MRNPLGHKTATGAFTLIEMMIAASVLTLILGGTLAGAMAMRRNIAFAETYPLAQMHLLDYLAMDMRRSLDVEPTSTNGQWTLPLKLTQDDFYKNSDWSRIAPVRTRETTFARKSKPKRLRIFESRWHIAYSESLSAATSTVSYYMTNGAVFRQEPGEPAMAIARGVESVTFTPASYDLTDPNGYTVVTRAVFRRNALFQKTLLPAGSTLSATTFLRAAYYAD